MVVGLCGRGHGARSGALGGVWGPCTAQPQVGEECDWQRGSTMKRVGRWCCRRGQMGAWRAVRPCVMGRIPGGKGGV